MAKRPAEETPEVLTGRKRTAPSVPPIAGGCYDESGARVSGPELPVTPESPDA